jgi:hypothetical protein
LAKKKEAAQMKTRLSPVIKLSLAAFLFGLAAFVSFRSGEASWRTQFAGGRAFPDLDPDAVAEIAVKAGSSSLTLQRVGGAWTVKERAGHPADFAKISKTLSSLASMKSARQLDDVSARELKELGLDSSAPAGPVIALSSQGGARLASLTLGRGHFRAGLASAPQDQPDGRYCLAAGASGSGVPILSNSLFDWLDLAPGKWIEAPSFDMTKALSIGVWSSKSGSWGVSRKTLKEPFAFNSPLKGAPAAKIIGAIVSALSKPPVVDLVSSDLASEFSLQETLSVSVALEGGSSVDFTFGFGEGRAVMKVSVGGKPSKWIYETKAPFVRSLLSPPPAEPTP